MAVEKERVGSSEVSISGAITGYLSSSDFLDRLRESSRISYSNDLKMFEAFCEKMDTPGIGSFTPGLQEQWTENMRGVGSSEVLIRRRKASLKGFIRWSKKNGLISGETYPTAGIFGPLDEARQAKLLDIMTSKGKLRDLALVCLIMKTGIPTGLIEELYVGNVRDEGGYFIRIESKALPRYYELDEETKNALLAYFKSREDRGRLTSKSPLIQGGKSGYPISRQGVWKVVKRYAALIDFEEFSPRVLELTYRANNARAGGQSKAE